MTESLLGECDQPLCDAYDLVMLDLDGVVYVGADPVPGAPAWVAEVRRRGARVAFVTNNAAHSPDTVAAHLRELGVEAEATDVVTSAQAAARLLADEHGHGARVVALGAEGLREALEDAGLEPVGVEDEADAIATGYGPQLPWRDIMRAAVRIRDGLPWVACNTDRTIPTSFGVAPGHGVLVDLLGGFTGVVPRVAGKPARPLVEETVRRVGGRRPLMVGDRLDTDIEEAVNAGVDSLLVLTGVTGLTELVTAAPGARPTYLAPDLAALLEPHARPRVEGELVRLGGWEAAVVPDLVVEGSGSAADWWRVVATAAWLARDRSGAPADTARLTPPGTDATTADPR